MQSLTVRVLPPPPLDRAKPRRRSTRFALANPTLFRLIFSSSAELSTSYEPEAVRFLRANSPAVLPTGADADAVQIGAVRSWALVHGLAMLMLDGQVPADDGLIDQVADAAA